MEVEARTVRLSLAETFVIAREAADFADVVHVSVTHEGVTGYGEAAPIERYGESDASALVFVAEHGSCSETTRSPSRKSASVLPLFRENRRPRRRSTRRCTISRGSCSRSPSFGCSACPGRGHRPRGPSGSAIRTTWRGGQRRRRHVSASQAQARRRRRPRRGARARGARRHGRAAHGRRERVVVARGGARCAPAAR